MPIVTAVPTPEEMRGVTHHFIETLPLDAYYNAARFEADVMELLPRLFVRNPVAVMCGGSMMYVDAVTDGIDELPDVNGSVRDYVARILDNHGLEGVMAQLEIVDPVFAAEVDRANTKRVVHALEISLAAGSPYSSLRQGRRKQRPFRIVKVVIDRPRQELFDRINRRVGIMAEKGLVEEARGLYPLRRLNALNTVGLKELFDHFEGRMTLDETLARIAKNTRVYAKKQLTWLGRPGVMPAVPVEAADVAHHIISLL